MAQCCKKAVLKWIPRFHISFVTLILLLFFLHIEKLTVFLDENAEIHSTLAENNLSTALNTCGQDEAFAYIPSATACKWAQTEFLMVFGIPSVDNDGRQRRRNLQRVTCWTFPEIATKENDYNGSMLVLYALARNPLHGLKYSKSLILEAKHWHDVVMLPVDEGRVTTNKKIGSEGKWGNEAEIGMGRKTFFWFHLALRAFPRTIYIGKCDDDMFMHVPQYLADLRLLPREKIYWGAYGGAKVLKNKQKEYVDVKFMVGYCMALARDTVEAIVRYEPLRRVVALPYSKGREMDFFLHTMHREDIMVGRALKESGYPVVFVAERRMCRFLYSGEGALSRNTSEYAVVFHHLKEHEYHLYMSYFIKKSFKIRNTIIKKISPNLYWVRCPIK